MAYKLPRSNSSSYTPLYHFTKSEISSNWFLGVNTYKRTTDYFTGKNIPQYKTMFIKFDDINHTPAKCLDFDTYLTSIRNKKRCAEVIKKFEDEGLPLDIRFDNGEFKTYFKH